MTTTTTLSVATTPAETRLSGWLALEIGAWFHVNRALEGLLSTLLVGQGLTTLACCTLLAGFKGQGLRVLTTSTEGIRYTRSSEG